MNDVLVFVTGLLVAAVASPFILRLLIALKSQQTIHKDAPATHQVKAGTPTMGGIIILIGAIAGLAVSMFHGDKQALPAMLLLIGFGIIGFVDDFVVPRMMAGKRGLGWMPKLAMQAVFGLGALYLSQPGLPGWALGTGLFFILFFTNAYNFSDGLDGLAGMLGLFLAIGFYLIQPGAAPLALIAGTIVFLYYNAPPARVFMGDVGALAIGAVFGLLFFERTYSAELTPTFTAYLSRDAFWYGAILSLVMIVELVPGPIQIFSVKVFKRKVFPYTPIHHAWEKAGWPETRVMFMFVMAQAVCTMLAVLFTRAAQL